MIMMIAEVNNILISWLCSRNLPVLQSQLADSRHEAPDPGAGGHADGGLVWFGHADGGLVWFGHADGGLIWFGLDWS